MEQISDLKKIIDYGVSNEAVMYNWHLLKNKCEEGVIIRTHVDGEPKTIKKEKRFTDEEINIIEEAYNFCEESHRGKTRKSGEPYYTHPLLATLYQLHIFPITDATSVAACLLHDVVEDSEKRGETLAKIESKFGDKIKTVVDGLTNIRGPVTEEPESFAKLLFSMIADYRVILIKLCDRLHNLYTLDGHNKPDKQIEIATETLEFFVPIAQRLGVWALKNELEELAFKHKDAKIFEQIKKEHIEQLKIDENYCNELQSGIKNILSTNNIECAFVIEHKTLYHIYSIMQEKNVEQKSIENYFSVVVVLQSNDVLECWRALGAILGHYPRAEQMIYDYINFPKFNQFRSLRTVVFDGQGRKVEVLIRTSEMEETAKNGIIKGLYEKEECKTLDLTDEELSILKKWVDEMIKERGADALGAIWDLMKINYYQKEIYAFANTKKYRLPEGATALDLALISYKNQAFYLEKTIVNGKDVHYSVLLNDKDNVSFVFSNQPTINKNWINSVVMFKPIANIYHYLTESFPYYETL